MPFQPALGVSDFRKLRESGAGYVDKTRFFAELLGETSEVLLFPRPRRFGKTLHLSALRYFLEKTSEDRSSLFEGLAIWDDPAARAHFQRYPVLFLTFKDVKARTWNATFGAIRGVVRELYGEHLYLLHHGGLAPHEARDFERILNDDGPEELYASSLKHLTHHLARHHGERVVVLIDEYDTPIHSGYLNGFFDDVVQLFRNFFSAALKDNTALFKGVLTGILRVSRESLFSGLNNVVVRSLLDRRHATAFGFTPAEVAAVLGAEGSSEQMTALRSWYDGYVFGGEVIYNPWSILNFIDSGELRPYWVNTSSNDLIADLIAKRGLGLSRDMERLLAGETIPARIDENIVLRDIDRRADALWSFLLFAGYLKPAAIRHELGAIEADLAVPNHEVMLAFKDLFRAWMSRGLTDRERVEALVRALLQGDAEALEGLLEQLLLTIMSYQDPAGREPERLYHGFILGLLVQLEGQYEVRSNRESGYGRADVLVRPRAPGQPGVVLELKVPNKRRGETPEAALAAAARQIRERRYAEELRAAGASPVHELAIVFDGKRVWAERLEPPEGTGAT